MPKLYYLVASALGKRFAPEVGSQVVDYIFAKIAMDRLAVLSIGLLEVSSILVRKRNSGALTPASYASAFALFDAELLKSTAIARVAHTVFSCCIHSRLLTVTRSTQPTQSFCDLHWIWRQMNEPAAVILSLFLRTADSSPRLKPRDCSHSTRKLKRPPNWML